jgi:hypothetical protein
MSNQRGGRRLPKSPSLLLRPIGGVEGGGECGKTSSSQRSRAHPQNPRRRRKVSSAVAVMSD